jgi:hypothetical protein
MFFSIRAYYLVLNIIFAKKLASGATTLNVMTSSITVFSLMGQTATLSKKLSVAMSSCYAECSYAEGHNAEYGYAERCYAERRYAECRGALKLPVSSCSHSFSNYIS